MDCPHCDPESFALTHPLKETDHFWVVCDVHPLTEGHILIIPKEHLSCVGEYDDDLFREFHDLYKEFTAFIQNQYGSVCTFEHGKIGQTVFHSHIHILPFTGGPEKIVPEGLEHLTPLDNLEELKQIFESDDQYLFFSMGNQLWTVDTQLGAPRFFRDRFAIALDVPERGNWKEMREDKELMKKGKKDIEELEKIWQEFSEE